MNKLTVFVASSEELINERNALGDLFRRLNDIYKQKGVSIKLKVWEDFDASYQGVRSQDAYNEILSQCDMFMVIFHKLAGKFTVEEFEIARDHFEEFTYPKVYTYVKDLSEGECETPELTTFKSRLFDELGHYWCRFDNDETMQLHFVMQIQLLLSNNNVKLEVKDSKVLLDNSYIASLNNVPFAANNEQFISLNKQLNDADKDIKKYESLFESSQSEALASLLKNKRIERENIKSKLDELEKSLFDTALMITSLYGEVTSERLRRAMELFESGDNKGANAVLDVAEISADVDNSVRNIAQNKVSISKAQDLARSTIKEYKQKIKFILYDAEGEDFLDKAFELYQKRLDTAQKSSLPLEEIVAILSEMVRFLEENPNIKDYKLKLVDSYNDLSNRYQELSDFYDNKSKSVNLD